MPHPYTSLSLDETPVKCDIFFVFLRVLSNEILLYAFHFCSNAISVTYVFTNCVWVTLFIPMQTMRKTAGFWWKIWCFLSPLAGTLCACNTCVSMCQHTMESTKYGLKRASVFAEQLTCVEATVSLISFYFVKSCRSVRVEWLNLCSARFMLLTLALGTVRHV